MFATPWRCGEKMFAAQIDLGNRSLHQLDMHPRGIIAQAISAVDNALWDARGKGVSGAPVSSSRWLPRSRAGSGDRRLCGCRWGRPILAIQREIAEILARGINGMKLKVGRASIEEDLERVRAARAAGGAEFVIALDANQRWTPKEAIRFCTSAEKANLNIRWMEEPIAWYDQTDGLRLLQEKTDIPITVGQGELTGQACRDLITRAGSIF